MIFNNRILTKNWNHEYVGYSIFLSDLYSYIKLSSTEIFLEILENTFIIEFIEITNAPKIRIFLAKENFIQ